MAFLYLADAAGAPAAAGEHVVHEDHGVARFAGFDTKTVAGVTRDYLDLEYAGTDRVFLPVDQLAKITRYVGAAAADRQVACLLCVRQKSCA